MAHDTMLSNARVPFTFEATRDIRLPLDPQLRPDGAMVVFELYAWEPEQQRQQARIWVAPTDGGGEARPFTTGANGDACPRWSPDGAQLAFISKRDADDKEQQQIYVQAAPTLTAATDGAVPAARRVCVAPQGAADLAWSPDGTRLAFLSAEGPTPKDEPVVDEPERHQRLWLVWPATGVAQPVTPPNLTIWSYAWSPDGTRLAVFFSAGPRETDWYQGQIGVVAASGGAVRQLTQLTRQAGALCWSRDGARLYYTSGEISDRPLVGGDIYVLAVDDVTPAPRNLTPGATYSPSWLAERADGRLLYVAWDGLSNHVGLLDPVTGAQTTLTHDFYLGDGAWPRLSASVDLRRVAGIHSDGQTPTEVWLGDVGEASAGGAETIAWRRLTRLSPIAEATLAIAPSERISYTGADGWRIEALYTPPLHAPASGTLPPLVVYVHGGPSSAWRETWLEQFSQIFAANGYATLRPNIRGSVGRGVAFADAVLGDMGGKDYLDMLAGVDYLIERGLVDGERLGIMGWSYGGFMTAWAVTQTNRFKVAMMGAGISDFHSFHAQSNIADWDRRFLAADQLDGAATYRARSALTYAARVTTATLICHGEQDVCVPVNQAYGFYRALKERGVATQLAVYPREGHGLRERDHLRDLYARTLAWFTRYL